MPVTMKNYEVAFRGPASSEQFNDTVTYVQRDILTAHRLLERENGRITNYFTAMNYYNQALSSKITGVTSELQQVRSEWSSSDGSRIIYVDFHNDASVDSLYTTSIPAFVDIVHGHARLITSQSWSKIPIFKNQDGFYDVTDDVTAYLLEANTQSELSNADTYQDRSTDIYKAFDRNPATFYFKEWASGDQPGYAASIRLVLPVAMNPSINSVLFHPAPQWELAVLGIDYLSLSGNWIEIPGSNMRAATNMMLHFYARDYDNQVRVRVRPSDALLYSLDSNPYRLIGIQNMDVGFIEYQSQGEIVTVHQGASTISAITGFEASYGLNTADAGDYSAYDKNYIWWEIFTERPTQGSTQGKVYDSRTNVYPLTSSSSAIPITASTTRLYVRSNFVRVSSTTPTLNSLTLRYST